MKAFAIISILFLVACNQQQSNKADQKGDTVNTTLTTPTATDTTAMPTEQKDTVLLHTAVTLLQAMKAKNFADVSTAIHPDKGLRFVPYGFVDTNKQKAFSGQELIGLSKQQQPHNWGIYDGSGDPINLTVSKYFERFVYDVDFLNANKTVNKVIGNTSINNVKTVYPESSFVQFYFQGVDPKFGGMDWKSLLLVFEEKDHDLHLVAVVHDQWKS